MGRCVRTWRDRAGYISPGGRADGWACLAEMLDGETEGRPVGAMEQRRSRRRGLVFPVFRYERCVPPPFARLEKMSRRNRTAGTGKSFVREPKKREASRGPRGSLVQSRLYRVQTQARWSIKWSKALNSIHTMSTSVHSARGYASNIAQCCRWCWSDGKRRAVPRRNRRFSREPLIARVGE